MKEIPQTKNKHVTRLLKQEGKERLVGRGREWKRDKEIQHKKNKVRKEKDIKQVKLTHSKTQIKLQKLKNESIFQRKHPKGIKKYKLNSE
jgi:hypothetical protein